MKKFAYIICLIIVASTLSLLIIPSYELKYEDFATEYIFSQSPADFLAQKRKTVNLSRWEQMQLHRLLRQNSVTEFRLDSCDVADLDIRAMIVVKNLYSQADTIFVDIFDYVQNNQVYKLRGKTKKFLYQRCDSNYDPIIDWWFEEE